MTLQNESVAATFKVLLSEIPAVWSCGTGEFCGRSLTGERLCSTSCGNCKQCKIELNQMTPLSKVSFFNNRLLSVVSNIPCEQLVSPTPPERETTASNRSKSNHA